MGSFLRRAVLMLIAAVGLALVVLVADYYWLKPVGRFGTPRLVAVKKGESLSVIAVRLKGAGVVRSAALLVLYADLTGQARRVMPGLYLFRGGERMPEVLRHLVNGDFLVVAVTVPEGATLHQVAMKLQEEGLACQTDFERAARQGPLLAALGFGPLGAEGYLFPATYRFSPTASTNEILGVMLARFYRIFTPEVEERLFALGLNAGELVTMASMIEKEAKMPAERPIIASVFYNRLRLGMPLQSDPTAQYNPTGEAEPAAVAVHTSSAFNTYVFVGLPPGPIANPGLSSIMAALYPATTDYLYFVARNDGTHVFSRSFREHRRAIAELKRSAPAPGLDGGAAGARKSTR